MDYSIFDQARRRAFAPFKLSELVCLGDAIFHAENSFGYVWSVRKGASINVNFISLTDFFISLSFWLYTQPNMINKKCHSMSNVYNWITCSLDSALEGLSFPPIFCPLWLDVSVCSSSLWGVSLLDFLSSRSTSCKVSPKFWNICSIVSRSNSTSLLASHATLESSDFAAGGR